MAQRSHNGYRRFDLAQRVEHGVLIASFTLLSLTGLPQKYPDSWWGNGMIQLMGGIELVRLVHHLAAALLIVQSLYHVTVIGYKIWVLRTPLTMMPGWQDLRHAIHTLGYNIGRVAQPPQMGRYTFGEKVEYWAVIWGTVLMIATGIVLWNPILITHLLPGQLVPAAKAAHGGEALLAVLSIIMWHMYNVHIKHFNRSMFTGYLDRHVMEEEHALELAAAAVPAIPRSTPRAIQRRRALYLPVAALFLALFITGAYLFLTYEQTAITTVPRQEIEVYVPVTATPEP